MLSHHLARIKQVHWNTRDEKSATTYSWPVIPIRIRTYISQIYSVLWTGLLISKGELQNLLLYLMCVSVNNAVRCTFIAFFISLDKIDAVYNYSGRVSTRSINHTDLSCNLLHRRERVSVQVNTAVRLRN